MYFRRPDLILGHPCVLASWAPVGVEPCFMSQSGMLTLVLSITWINTNFISFKIL